MNNEFNKKDNSAETNCLIQDGTIFIGLSSLPLGREIEVNKTIEKLLKNFKKRLNRKIKDYTVCDLSNEFLKDLNEYFYIPKKYYLLGEFDLALITLIDGFSFPVREFSHKSFYLNAENPTLEISRHNILGPTPKFNDRTITDVFKNIFSERSKYPLISISRLKLNDIFLLEKGTDFIRGSIKLINKKLKDKKKENNAHEFNFLIIENYSWSEVTIVFFVNNYKIVSDLMLLLRNLVHTDLIEALDNEDSGLSSILSEKKHIVLREDKYFHLFIDSHSIFGFDHDLFSEFNTNSRTLYNKILKTDSVKHNIKISVKPGFIKKAMEKIKKIEELFLFENSISSQKNSNFNIIAGKSDIIYYINNNTNISTKTLIDWIINLRLNIKKIHYINNISTEIIVEHSFHDLKEKDENPESYLVEKELEKLVFKPNTLKLLNDYMSSIYVPHVIKESILNLFSIFNNKISDRLAFSPFIELRPFLIYILRIIRHSKLGLETGKSYDMEILLKSLDPAIHAFHHAYYNRVLGQYKNGNQYDQPMFFNLGSQLLISAFDILYKNITNVIGNKASFVYVESDQNFTISDFALRLNYFHVFNPELLCAVLFQESMNQCSSRFRHKYPQLFKYNRESDSDQSIDKIYSELKNNNLTSKEVEANYQDILNALTPEFFEHIFSDLVGYRLFYQNNPEMYTYWSWGYFSTDSKHFIKKKGQLYIKYEYFIPFLVRQLIVLKCFNIDFYNDYNVKFNPNIDKAILKKLNQTKRFLDLYLFQGNLLGWINSIKDFSEEKFKEINKNQNSFDENEIINKFMNGQVISYNVRENHNETFQYTRLLLFAYLKAFTKLTGKTKSINIVDREIKSGENDKNKINYSNILFDTHGGIYIIHPEMRRKIYKLRSTFHMSIIDMSLKTKGQLLKEMINSEKDQISDISIDSFFPSQS